MTTFILSGGNINSANEKKIEYYNFLLNSFDNANILVIAFARDKSEWPVVEEETKKEFARYSDNVDVTSASTDPNKFKNQVSLADIVILKGGNTDMLIDHLSKLHFADLNLKNKIISGSSAGAYALSKKYYSLTHQGVKRGLGLIDTNIIVHYLSPTYRSIDWIEAVNNFDANEPILLIPEKTFEVIVTP